MALLAFAYVVAGRLSLLLAIPPGYATAVWPGAGIALAALLVYGRGLWPAVVLGSVLVNWSLGSGQSFDAAGMQKLATAIAIGIGAAGQALLGAALTRRFLERDPELLVLRSITGLLILGGPLSCLLNATLGVSVLFAARLIGHDELGFSWLTWWVGDSMGVLTCCPLLLLWLGPPKQAWSKHLHFVALPLTLLFAFSVAVFMFVSGQEQENLSLQFRRGGEVIASALDKEMVRSIEAVHTIASYFGSGEPVSREQFRSLVARSLETSQTIRALSWNPLVLDANRPLLEAMGRASGFDDFQVTERDAWDRLVPATRRDKYVAVLYLEPLASNRDALGYDVYSEPTRRAALDLARDTGQSVATSLIKPVQEAGDDRGVLVFVPAYHAARTTEALKPQRGELIGYGAGVFRPRELLTSTLQGFGLRHSLVRLYDDSGAQPVELAAYRAERDGRADSADSVPVLTYEQRYSFGARRWRLVITAERGYLTAHHSLQGWGALVACLLFTSLFGVLMLVLTARKVVDARWTLQLEAANHSLNTEVEQRLATERALYSEKERAQVTLHSIGDAVITTDAAGRVEYLNPAAERLTEWSCAEARGRLVSEVFSVVDEERRQPVADHVKRCLEGARTVELTKALVLISRSGREYAVADSLAPIRDPHGGVQGAVLVFHDVTENRRMARAVEYQATHDALTGLVNRTEFGRRVERALASCKQYSRQHALCYLDLDQFKVVNDTCGHRAGDELLKRITGLLSHAVRDRDTLARLGGDEFGLLLENCPLSKAVEITRTLVALVHDFRFVWEGKLFTVGVSIGLVPVTGQVETAEALFANADAACYAAKELGRNRVHVYQASANGADPHHDAILRVTDIRRAIENDRFQLFSQPIWAVEGESRTPTCHEMLIRMLDDRGTLVQPGYFIPIAERFGLMERIDRWVVQQTFGTYRELFAGDDRPNLSINLSGSMLGEENLLPFLREQFDRHGVAPDKICFEITETSAIRNISAAKNLIGELRDVGCKFALDDFGSGLSSFGYLKALPVDFLKIDGNLVRRIAEERVDRAMVEAINRLAHQMGMQTIAEYVESAECMAVVRELGVDQAQGFALGMPRPVLQPAQTLHV